MGRVAQVEWWAWRTQSTACKHTTQAHPQGLQVPAAKRRQADAIGAAHHPLAADARVASGQACGHADADEQAGASGRDQAMRRRHQLAANAGHNRQLCRGALSGLPGRRQLAVDVFGHG